MNQIDRMDKIDICRLDQSRFFQSVFQEICLKNLLTKDRIEEIQLELIELLGKEVERYTNGESTSIRVEKAQELLLSITYCLGIYLKEMGNSEGILEVLNNEKISTIFYKGMDSITSIKNKAERLLKELQKNFLNISNYSYRDTLNGGLDEFFHSYEMEFQAYEIPANIDYQLFLPIEKLEGVEYIYEYLRRFTLEQRFITEFGEEPIGQLLYGFHKDSEHMLINIYELVLTNALGCAMLDKGIKILDLSAAEIDWLQKKLNLLDDAQLRDKLTQAMDWVAKSLCLNSESVIYAQPIIEQLAVRLRNNLKTKTLGEIFISFTVRSVESGIMIEGIPMEDEKLRALIDELKELPLISDKVIRIRETVQSLEDLTELLEESFYGEEYEKVFQLFSDQEKVILKEKILNEAGVEGGEDYVPDKQWQKTLFSY